MKLHPTQYRTRRLLDLCHIFIVPGFILNLSLCATTIRLSYLTIPCYLAFCLAWAYARGSYSDYVQTKKAEKLRAVPIPRVIGLLPGNVDILWRMMKKFPTSYILDVYLELFEEYQCTTLNTRLLWTDQIITMDEEHSKFVISTGFSYFWRGRLQKERMETFLGDGIFNRDDELWKMHRGIARPFFARERISDFDLFEKHAKRTLSIISTSIANDAPVEAQDLYGRFSLDSASEFLFGLNLDTLSGPFPLPGQASLGPKGSTTDDEFGSFAAAFEECQQIITHRGRLGYFWPLYELFGDRTARPTQIIKRWLGPLVERALMDKARMIEAGIQSPVGEKTFLQHLADSTQDPKLIRDQLLSMLTASRDTTACLLTYVTYFMAMHPDVTRKLRSEVIQYCGTDSAPTYDGIRNMRYLRAVINETLRLFPPVPLNVRESRPTPFCLPRSDPTYPASTQPLYMPPETNIVYLPLLTQRNPVLWGSDADVFDPERWLDPARLKTFTNNPMMYAPFSAGPRVCVGQNYALNEASYFLVRLLQRFDTFTLAPEAQPKESMPPVEWKSRRGRQAYERLWPAAALTLYAKGGLWVRYGGAAGS